MEAGTATAANARIGKVNTTSGIVNTLVSNAASIGTALVPKALAVSQDGSKLHFPLQYRNWPWYAFPCAVSTQGGDVACASYSPPQPVAMAEMGGTVYWGTRFTVTQLRPATDTVFSHVGTWSRPGAMLVYDGALHWVDQIDGRIYRHIPEE